LPADDRFQVTIVKYGTRRTVRSDVYLNYHLYGEPDGPIGMDYFFWVVRNAQHTFVVDTGFSAAGGARRNRTTLIEPAAALDALDVDRDAATVIVTHAHYDHIGNLDLFPAGPVVISRSEYDFWTGPYATRTLVHHSVEDDEIAHLRKVRDHGRLRMFEERITLAPGVEVIEVGGHTPGQSIVLVDTADGPVLLASDAVHYYEEYERSMPFTQVADVIRMYGTFELIRGMAEVKHLVPGHDPDTLRRFTPVGGPLSGLAATVG
jgi:glyoxylase-like metal-dependent hydrolase (beta-lactamase superfamily II)